jgi:hypothetical protein
MTVTKFRNFQSRDSDLTFQYELENLEDNNTGLFNPSTMNNKNLHDLIRLLQDNNTTGFNSSTMNNKNLYDLIQQFRFSNFDSTQDSTFQELGKTSSWVNYFTWNTNILIPGRYKLEYKLNYSPLGFISYINSRLISSLFSKEILNTSGYRQSQNFSKTCSGTIGEFIVNTEQSITINLEYTCEGWWIFSASFKVGNISMFLIRYGDI